MEDYNLDDISFTIMCSSLYRIEKLFFSSYGCSSNFCVNNDCIEALIDVTHKLTNPMELLFIEDNTRWCGHPFTVVKKLNQFQNKVKTLLYNKQVVFTSEKLEINAATKKRSEIILENMPLLERFIRFIR